MASRRTKAKSPKLTTRRLEQPIDDATVDAQDGSEQLSGIHDAMEQDLELPLETALVGIGVTVESIKVGADGSLVALCRVGRHQQQVPLFYLPDPETEPEGWEWVEAYRHWCRMRV